MRLHRQDHDRHDRGAVRVRDRHDDADLGGDLPPPAPQDAVVTRDVEERIREDERARMRAELEALANNSPTENSPTGSSATDRMDSPTRTDGRPDPWDEFASGRPDAPAPDAATDTGDINLAALRRDDVRHDEPRTGRDDVYISPTPAGGVPVVERDVRLDGEDHRETLGRRDYVEEEVVRDRAFSVGQAITMLVGLALTAWGIIALVATGIDTPLDQPVEEVFGFDHTPWMGIGEVAAGVLLILAALRPQGRWLTGLVGVALIAAGAMILAEMDWTIEELSTEQSFGWIPIIAGALALLGAVLTPPRHQRVTETHVVDEYDRYDDR